MQRKLSIAALTAAFAAICVILAHNLFSKTSATSLSEPPNGKPTTLPNGWKVTPAGRQIPLQGDLVMKLILTPDGKSLLASTGGYHDHSVSLIDLQTEKVVSSVDAGKDWAGMSLQASTNTIFLSGGGPPGVLFMDQAVRSGVSSEMIASYKKPVLRLSLNKSSLEMQPALAIPGLNEKERFVAGTLAGPGGELFVINTQNDTVYRLSGDSLDTVASVRVGYRPYAAALSPSGKELAVSNWGDESVSLLDPKTLQEKVKVKAGSHPNDLSYAKDGRLFVANSGSNSVSVIRADKVVETIKTSLSPSDPVGSTPDAVAIAPDGKRLYVANADNNDVAVIDISSDRESKILGFIPTGWYPTALAVSSDGKKLFVGAGKGMGSRANFPARLQKGTSSSPNPKTPYDYIGRTLTGWVSVIDLPDKSQLAAYTTQVRENIPRPNGAADPAYASRIQKEVFGKIKHVLYVIRENRTYDQVLGDLGKGNGDASLTLFGEAVTPNAHELARKTVLLDNIYCNGEVSEDGHQWCNAAYATDFTEKAWPNSYSRRGEPEADGRLVSSPAGYLWESCARNGLTYRSYGEFASFTSTPNSPPKFKGHSGLEGHASAAWDLVEHGDDARDTQRADTFIAELTEAEKTGEWPRFMVMHLGEDHTEGLVAGRYSPIAHVAANDQALGKIVEAISHSRFWSETAIFVIEDDAQNGPDHVDAHRTVALVISPYVKQGTVDSTMYSTVSVVRTMELILGLQPMTQYDRAATPLFNAFATDRLLQAYSNLAARVDLEARNPATGPGARASARLDFSDVDRADPDALNKILWEAIKGNVPMPAPVHSARLGS
jgi:YVTN family beta-propeller protein